MCAVESISKHLGLVAWSVLCLSFTCLFDPAFAKAEGAPSSNTPLRIGAILGVTGLLADMGVDYRDGMLLAVEELQQKNRGKIELLLEDSRWEPKGAMSCYQKLRAAWNVRVVVTLGSTNVIALKSLTEKEGVLLFGQGTHPGIISNSNIVIRHWPRATEDAQAVTQFIASKGLTRIAELSLEAEGPRGFDLEFDSLREEKLAGIAFDRDTHGWGDRDVRAQLLKLFHRRPELVIVNSFGMTSAVALKQSRELNYKGMLLLGIGFRMSLDAIREVREKKVDEFYYVDFDLPLGEFQNAFAKKYGREPSTVALIGYSDTELALWAHNATGGNPQAMAKFIRAAGEFQGTYETLHIEPSGDIPVPTTVKKW